MAAAKITAGPNRRKRAKRALDQRRYQLRRLYNITPERVAAMIREQGGCCGICGGPLGSEKGTPHVEHSHETNIVRSIAHGVCNRIIGLAHESVPRLLACIKYIEFHHPR